MNVTQTPTTQKPTDSLLLAPTRKPRRTSKSKNDSKKKLMTRKLSEFSKSVGSTTRFWPIQSPKCLQQCSKKETQTGIRELSDTPSIFTSK